MTNTAQLRLEEEYKKAKEEYEIEQKEVENAEKTCNRFGEKHGLDSITYRSELEEVEESIADSEKQIAAISAKLQLLTCLQGTLVGEPNQQMIRYGTCPLCHADKEHWKMSSLQVKSQVQELYKSCDVLKDSVKCLTEKRNAINQYDNLLQGFDRFQLLASRSRDAMEEAHEAYAAHKAENTYPNVASDRLVHLRRLIAERDEYQAKYGNAVDKVEQTKKLWQSIDTHINELEEQREEILRHLPHFPEEDFAKICRENIRAIKEKLQEVRKLSNEILRLEGNKEEAEQHLDSLHRRLDTAKAQLAESGDSQKWFEHCEKALNWLKYTGLPKLVHGAVLNNLASTVNSNLADFGNPFTVKVSDNLSFVAYFEDEREIPAKALSGGQRTILGLDFWSAVNRVFAKNLGVLAIDEPSSELDDDNQELFYKSLVRWKQMLHQRGQQVIIITHSPCVENACDHVIRL
jgi:DNA repair exonuclease SbcCD ATPase subunit